jgi:hypothetical protein
MIGCSVWVLLGMGLFFILGGAAVDSGGTVFFGLLFIGAGAGLLAYALRPGGILRKDEVIDSWSAQIEGAEGHADEIFTSALEQIKETKAPNLSASRTVMSPSFSRGLMNVYRDFVVVNHSGNHRLDPYQLYVNARDYGTSLVVDWHLTYRPTIFKLIMLVMFKFARGTDPLDELDLFDQQDLRAYATTAHRCVLSSVSDAMIKVDQDPSKLERKSRGFLGIS